MFQTFCPFCGKFVPNTEIGAHWGGVERTARTALEVNDIKMPGWAGLSQKYMKYMFSGDVSLVQPVQAVQQSGDCTFSEALWLHQESGLGRENARFTNTKY